MQRGEGAKGGGNELRKFTLPDGTGASFAPSRGPGAPAFHKLQCWHQGRNHTRYVPAQEVAALQEALAGHECFQRLAQEFADLTITMTQQETVECKKNSKRSRPNATGKPKRS